MATSTLRYESATVKVYHWDKKVASISNLFSRQRRKGHARKLMEWVNDYADEKDITLQLVPGRYGHPIGPGNEVLIKFYESLGFKKLPRKNRDAPLIMQRSPVSQEKQLL